MRIKLSEALSFQMFSIGLDPDNFFQYKIFTVNFVKQERKEQIKRAAWKAEAKKEGDLK